MSIALAHHGTREENIREALEQISTPGLAEAERILIKPNLTGLYHNHANTHVEAVAAVIEWIRGRTDARVEVGEGSGTAYYSGKTTHDVYRRMNYERLKVPLIDFNDYTPRTPYYPVEVETTRGPRQMRVRGTDYDYIVSLGLPKTHDYVPGTYTIKNMMGLVHPDDRIMIHGAACQRDIAGPLADLLPGWVKEFFYPYIPQWLVSRVKDEETYNRQVKLIHRNLARLFHAVGPDLGVLDGTVGMEGYGPVQGTPVELGVVVVGTDPVQVDTLGATLMGINPENIGYLVLLEEQDMGSMDLAEVEYGGLIKHFKPHRDYESQIEWR